MTVEQEAVVEPELRIVDPHHHLWADLSSGPFQSNYRLEELRADSQLIVITHQKRTMEIADALYGVTMRGDGVTTVISQRLRDVEDQPA